VRRLTVFVLVAVLSALTLTASATGGSTENIKDKFTSISWGGSDGSLPWAGSWQEDGDDDDEKFGNVRVVSSGNCASGNCMQIGALTTLLTGAIGASRRSDTSDLVEMELCFDIKATGSLGGSQLQVQVDGGDGWETVKTYNLSSEFSEHRTIDIADFSSEEFGVRFRFTSALLGSQVFIDNVEIQGVVEESEETTTTTTVDDTTTTTSEGTTPTTTEGTTTTTKPRSTTTTEADSTTTTTVAGETTSTTAPGASTSSTVAGPDRAATPGGSATTTSTTPGEPGTTDDPPSDDPGIGPDGTGIRAAARGLQASFQGDLYGEVRTVSSLGRVDLQADYNMAVEVIKATWAWVVVLGLVMAWAIVSGLDRRREDLEG
jgi:hypothetical protein